MNKSLEFVAKRMANQNEEPISEATCNISIYKFSDFITKLNDEILCGSTLGVQDSDITVEMKQADENFSEFDYYASHCEYNDGTLMFVAMGVKEIVQKLLTLRSRPTNKIKSATDLIGVQKIIIKIGDIIVCHKTDKSPVKEKPWMTNKLEIFIPAYFELIKI